MTAYTNGVNGVLVDDYEAAIRAEELFRDEAPTLLRVPLIIGHRGDPSIYVENTLQSDRGAFSEGVDSVENDIQLSKDGELFILHDDSPKRLLGIGSVESRPSGNSKPIPSCGRMRMWALLRPTRCPLRNRDMASWMGKRSKLYM